MRKTIDLGKADAYGKGRKINRVTVEVELSNGRLSMTGNVWNARETDIDSGGQNLEEIRSLFPGNAKVKRMVEVWQRWHLNDMRAGNPAQEAYLREHGHGRNYEETCQKLAEAGLLVDNGYKYGSAWLSEELPAEVVQEVESW